jgi:hypothetical protein
MKRYCGLNNIYKGDNIMNKILIEITVPHTDNKGKGLDLDTRKQVEKLILKNAGGFSTITNVHGSWLDDNGKRYNDISTLYRIIADNNPSVIANIRHQALVLKQELDQECILFTTQEIKMEYIA